MKNLEQDLVNPLFFHKLIVNTLPNTNMTSFPVELHKGVRIHFQGKQKKENFSKKFQETDSGPNAKNEYLREKEIFSSKSTKLLPLSLQ